MAWVKVPKEHHPIFLAALPDAPDLETLAMFGAIAVKVNGHMAGGLFGLSAMVRVGEADRKRALAEGGAPFDPMGNGRGSPDAVMLPESVMASPAELRGWLEKALAFARSLPPKGEKPAARKAATRPAARKAATKPAARKAATKPARAKSPR